MRNINRKYCCSIQGKEILSEDDKVIVQLFNSDNLTKETSTSIDLDDIISWDFRERY